MNFTKIVFKPKETTTHDLAGYLISNYLFCLYRNGQIQRDYALTRKDNFYYAFVTSTDINSLNEKFNSEIIKDEKEKLEFDIEYEIIGTSQYSDEMCKCESESGYILLYGFSLNGSPVRCIDCWKDVPLYRFPYILNQKDYHTEVYWAHGYKAVEELWENGYYKNWSRRQMIDPKSELSQTGRKICKEFEKATGKPFFYYLIDPNVRHKRNLMKICPECGEEWKESKKTLESGTVLDFCFCDKCRLCIELH